MHEEITIERLVLRLAGGDDHADWERLANDVAAALYERVRVAGITGQLHLARLHIRLSGEVAPEQLPGAIADRIWEAIR